MTQIYNHFLILKFTGIHAATHPGVKRSRLDTGLAAEGTRT
jgi:hypothetical protein